MPKSDESSQNVGSVSDLTGLVKQAIEKDARFTLIAPSDEESSPLLPKAGSTFKVQTHDGGVVEVSVDILMTANSGREHNGEKRKPLSVELREARNGRVLPLLEPGKPRFNQI